MKIRAIESWSYGDDAVQVTELHEDERAIESRYFLRRLRRRFGNMRYGRARGAITAERARDATPLDMQ
jgi:hypothetical protein